MKKNFLAALCLSGSIVMFTSCMQNVVIGRGDKTTDQRELNSFTAVRITTPVDAVVVMEHIDKPFVELSGYENVFPYIKTEIKGNTLHVFTDKNVRIDNDRGVDVKIHMPRLTALSISGASDVVIANTIEGDAFELSISGAGDVDIDDIHVTNFSASISGAGDLTVKKGMVEHASYQLSGAGDIKAYPLVAKNVDASVSGAGDIKLHATEHLNASVSGVGSIDYKGHPQLKTSKSGIGSIENKD